MKNILSAQWIKSPKIALDREICFSAEFETEKPIEYAELEVTALGVYKAEINGNRVGDYILAPGYTSYGHCLQVETYDVAEMLEKKNKITLSVAPGWKAHGFFGRLEESFLGFKETAAICALTIKFTDGETRIITSGGNWKCENGKTIYSDVYNGYVYDPSYTDPEPGRAKVFPCGKSALKDRVGEKVIEHERLPAKEIIITPKGEKVIDFGQNLTGYVEFVIKGKKGERAVISHGETLDGEGNFYNANYRSAKAQAVFICDGEEHRFKPDFNFYGFRYIKLDGFSDEIKKENFTAVVVHSDIKRTGSFECSDERVNKLFSNIIWSQKGNFLDIPSD